MELDLGSVRTFLAVVDDAHFTDAADRLGLTQQAVSKRIARLESDLGAPLLNRSRAGARLTDDGAAFLPHARALISLADQAAGMFAARRRALRIDALARDAAPSDLVRSFYETSDVAVDLVVSRGAIAQQTALTDGSVDAAFGRVTTGLAPGIERVPALLEPLFVLVGRRHRLARRKRVPTRELSGLTAWMPANASDSEWAQYYRFFSAEFGVAIDTSGPVFGRDHIVERIGASPDLITFAAKTQLTGSPDVVHLPVTDPVPVYPWSLLWHGLNRHPALPLLIAHAQARYRPYDPRTQWLPAPDRLLFPDVALLADRPASGSAEPAAQRLVEPRRRVGRAGRGRPRDVAVGPDEQRGGGGGRGQAPGADDAEPRGAPARGSAGDRAVAGQVEQNTPSRAHQLGDAGAAVAGLQLEIRRQLPRQRVRGAAARHRVADVRALHQLADPADLVGLPEQVADLPERIGLVERVAEQRAQRLGAFRRRLPAAALAEVGQRPLRPGLEDGPPPGQVTLGLVGVE
jgi:DNA-binding transcriptional LysR family regulator